MACPFFLPTAPVPSHERRVTGRWPLLAIWQGECHAGQVEFAAPSGLLERCCNLGYARGDCPHFPAGSTRDAVRFTVLPGGHIHYVIESAYGPLEYGLADQAEDPIVRRQAEAFLEGYAARQTRGASGV